MGDFCVDGEGIAIAVHLAHRCLEFEIFVLVLGR